MSDTPSSRPKPFKLYVLLIFFTAVLSAVLTYFLAVPELHRSLVSLGEAEEQLKISEKNIQSLNAEKILLEQQSTIIRGANNRLLETENEYQSEIAQISSELAFYRRLAGAGGKLEGLTINKFMLQQTASERVAHFKLTLTQNLQKARTINGDIHILVRGTLANQPGLLNWQSLHPENTQLPKFSFKYFQQVEGYLTLPQDFIPESVEITLKPEKKSRVQASFSWQDIISSKP
ncbi:MAG: hypothetical protein L3J22_05250 [Xanthomonadales bacterium]|nr:hypothetical protein [Xanthomonadales bacterium]